MTTDVQQMIEDLDGGVFLNKLSRALSDVAGAVTDHSKKGSVSITFDMKQLGTGAQVMISHKLSYERPTIRGSVTENEKTETPMYVGPKGLTLMPHNQGDIFEHQES